MRNDNARVNLHGTFLCSREAEAESLRCGVCPGLTEAAGKVVFIIDGGMTLYPEFETGG